MNRNALVVESLRKPAGATAPGVWSMSLALLGAAFGAPARRGPVR
ncbi:hypothetical protein [Brevundimonas sp. LM2]|nr:hypothetical protein [Brevundimonas sp. LM2]